MESFMEKAARHKGGDWTQKKTPTSMVGVFQFEGNLSLLTRIAIGRQEFKQIR